MINKILLIIKREYLSRVTKRSFWITTLLAPLGMALMIVVPILLEKYGKESTAIMVLDETAQIAPLLKNDKQLSFDLAQNVSVDSLKKVYIKNGFQALLYIPKDFTLHQNNGISIYSKKALGLATGGMIEDKMNDAVFSLRIKNEGLSQTKYDSLLKKVSIQQFVTEDTKDKQSSSIAASAAGYATGFLLYILLLLYGTSVMRSVMEEKTNRIVEVLISSVKPSELLLGKIIGVAAVGITQFALWLVLGAVVNGTMMSFFTPDAAHMGTNMPNVDNEMMAKFNINNLISGLPIGNILFSVLFYFLGGYLIYASLFAAIGSAVGDDLDSQGLTIPVTTPIIVSLLIMMNALNNPDGNLAFWASMFPLTSPIVMPARIPFGVPIWQQLLSMVLLVLGFLATVWLAAKVYRTGILMYGKKGSFKEMIKWIRR